MVNITLDIITNIVWTKIDGKNIKCDVYIPNNNNKFPIVLIFYGGGFLIHNKERLKPLATYIAEKGYVVCCPDYRHLGENVNLNDCINDGFGAYYWIKTHGEKYKGDTEKIFLMGNSSGGIIAGLIANGDHLIKSPPFHKTLGFNPSYLPNIPINFKVSGLIFNYSCPDMIKCAGILENPNVFWKKSHKKRKNLFGNKYSVKKNPQLYKAVSPLYTLPKNDICPHLLIVGNKDPFVTIKSLKKFKKKIIRYGGFANIVIVKDIGHDFLNPSEFYTKQSQLTIEKICKFLDKFS